MATRSTLKMFVLCSALTLVLSTVNPALAKYHWQDDAVAEVTSEIPAPIPDAYVGPFCEMIVPPRADVTIQDF